MAEDFRIEPATVDQAAAALALLLGAIGSLLLIVWQSRCLCRCRIGISDTCLYNKEITTVVLFEFDSICELQPEFRP